MNPQQQALLARLASYLEQQDQADTAAPTAGVAEAPDLFTLLSELAALRNEVKIESQGLPGLGEASLVDGDWHSECIVEYHRDGRLVGVVGVNRTREVLAYRDRL